MTGSVSTVTPRLMRDRKAAEYLGISERKLRALREIPRKKKDGMVFYDRHDLDAFADDLPYETPVEEIRDTTTTLEQAFGDL